MSIPLTFRIFEHLKELGLLKEGETILDPMCGIATTGIVAGALGYPFIGVELEGKFVDLAWQNKEYAERRLYKDLDWQIIQGDSRHLSELLSERGLVSVTSPPYEQSDSRNMAVDPNKNKSFKDASKMKGHGGGKIVYVDYGATEGQIGNLKDTPLKSITSPPYGIEKTSGGLNTKPPRNKQDQAGRNPNSPSQSGAKEGYGETAGQIGVLPDTPLKAITSPPYGESIKGGKSGIDWQENWGRPSENRQPSQDISYGQNKANLGNLPDKPLKSVMSPPYDAQGHPSLGSVNKDNWGKQGKDIVKRRGLDGTCEIRGESYLSAMLQVYKEIARVSDVLVVVIKNPTKNGKLRRLDLDTIKIMQMAGWNIYCQHRALLFEELEQPDLFGKTLKQVKGRLSFFKRLSWQKGQPVASWEDILIGIR